MCNKSYCQLSGEKVKAWEVNDGDVVTVPYCGYNGETFQLTGTVTESVRESERSLAEEGPIMSDVRVKSDDGETVRLYLDYRPIIVMAHDSEGRYRDYRLTTPGIHRHE